MNKIVLMLSLGLGFFISSANAHEPVAVVDQPVAVVAHNDHHDGDVHRHHRKLHRHRHHHRHHRHHHRRAIHRHANQGDHQ
ncbi:MAG: hypothetical protein V4525_14115 [Pseudomonadota bacterium]